MNLKALTTLLLILAVAGSVVFAGCGGKQQDAGSDATAPVATDEGGEASVEESAVEPPSDAAVDGADTGADAAAGAEEGAAGSEGAAEGEHSEGEAAEGEHH